jgi:hypothetical protein
MKIEMGESLMLSWLKHIKKCQTAQLNWKASTHSWDLHNEETIKKIFMATKKFYTEKQNLNIYKNTSSHSQLLQQGEIDVLGLEIKNGSLANIYGVDVAFHEAGLNYGSTTASIERVIKKMIRTALLLYGYFNVSKGTILFASPKINTVLYEPLKMQIDVLNKIFRVFKLEFEFILYANQEFKTKVFEPVITLSKSVADTSELFLRSSQMYNLLSESNEPRARQPLETRFGVRSEVKSASTGASEDDMMKIGQLVRSEFERLARHDLITNEMAEHLLDSKYSKETFDVNYPILKKIRSDQTLIDQRMINGYPRYWSKVFKINGVKYFICNDWYERSRTKFLNWLGKLQ